MTEKDHEPDEEVDEVVECGPTRRDRFLTLIPVGQHVV